MTLSIEQLRHAQASTLPDYLGFELVDATPERIAASLTIAPHHLAPNGFLHAATIVMLADTCCGYGCLVNLPDDAASFTTIELKSNHLGTARAGTIRCQATPVHLGKTTQVWDAVVTNDKGKTIALFRCTQMILQKRAG